MHECRVNILMKFKVSQVSSLKTRLETTIMEIWFGVSIKINWLKMCSKFAISIIQKHNNLFFGLNVSHVIVGKATMGLFNT